VCGGRYHGLARGWAGPRNVEEAEQMVKERVAEQNAPSMAIGLFPVEPKEALLDV
jgi:hypothetical protein